MSSPTDVRLTTLLHAQADDAPRPGVDHAAAAAAAWGRPWWRRRVSWVPALALCAVIVITGFELIAGKPVSSLTGGTKGGGTSFSRFDNGQHHPSRSPSVTTSPSATPQPSKSPSARATPSSGASPTATPSEPVQSESPSSEPTESAAASPTP